MGWKHRPRIPATPEAEAGGSQIQGLPGLQLMLFSGCCHHFHLTKGKLGLREPKPLHGIHTATRVGLEFDHIRMILSK